MTKSSAATASRGHDRFAGHLWFLLFLCSYQAGAAFSSSLIAGVVRRNSTVALQLVLEIDQWLLTDSNQASPGLVQVHNHG